MGQNFRECWASAWPAIGDLFERALRGETGFLEDQRVFVDRNGYLEEAFFTFSFSPIRDETGNVGGLFHPVTETTGRMLSERRTRVLRDIDDISFAMMTSDDVVRHTLVGRIVDAYTKYDAERQARDFARREGRTEPAEGARTPTDYRPPQNRAERRAQDPGRYGDGRARNR